ncbi:MAG: WD40/YVTN/BNR-like repeat-containing protein [Nocardioidaceae bacterium]|jgi:photosystem II stability/assembly factor-like uncharacterized protein
MSTETIALVGTRKGLWIGRSDEARVAWKWDGPHFNMQEVYSCMVDTRGGRTRLFAGAASSWLGPQVAWSDDLGGNWEHGPDGGIRFPADTGASVERIWQLQPGIGDDVVWAGTEPGAVWRSEDGGQTFTLERGLWDHPQRPEWGAGYGGQAFHTVLPHPSDPDSLTAAISTGGVYQTTDGGGTWTARNKGIRAEFLPEGQQYPEFGQCVHKVARHPSRPERLFLQNHGGVYRSDDEGGSWVSIADGLPSDFGFPIVVDPHAPDTVYAFPLQGADGRYPPGGAARVWRSRDAGETWEALGAEEREGLPDGFFVGVMRDAMSADDHDQAGLYFGARDGSVWGSFDDGATWHELVRGLPDVMVVRAGRVQ